MGQDVLLCIPNGVLRHALGELLGYSGFKVVASAAAIEKLPEFQPTTTCRVLICSSIAHNSAALVSSKCPQATIVILGGHPDRAMALRGIDAGAHAWLDDDTDIEAFLNSLKAASPERIVISIGRFQAPPLVSFLVAPPPEPDRSAAAPQLSPRETSILTMLREGAANKEIARSLEVTEATVKVHLKAILQKIRASNRTQAAIWATSNLQR